MGTHAQAGARGRAVRSLPSLVLRGGGEPARAGARDARSTRRIDRCPDRESLSRPAVCRIRGIPRSRFRPGPCRHPHPPHRGGVEPRELWRSTARETWTRLATTTWRAGTRGCRSGRDRTGDHRRPRRLGDRASGVLPPGRARAGDEVFDDDVRRTGRFRVTGSHAVRQVGFPTMTVYSNVPAAGAAPHHVRGRVRPLRSATTPTTSSSSPRWRSERSRRIALSRRRPVSWTARGSIPSSRVRHHGGH